jgi:hypothetical protein
VLLDAVLDRCVHALLQKEKSTIRACLSKGIMCIVMLYIQIFSETFEVVEFVTKAEIVKKLMSRRNYQKCIAFVKASRIHSGRTF